MEDFILMEEEGEVEIHSATRLLQRMILGAGASKARDRKVIAYDVKMNCNK